MKKELRKRLRFPFFMTLISTGSLLFYSYYSGGWAGIKISIAIVGLTYLGGFALIGFFTFLNEILLGE
ncbi:MAG: hypothetical protein NTX00_00270 [Candidatus Parcubacteria bacterium]|nr:hypothetical protein [Candidatus Parcubacteria bacterium]